MNPPAARPPLIGVFVGGAARRMGGLPKGLVALDTGERVIERTVRVAREAFPEARVVLVGRGDAYASLGLDCVPDALADVGPLGGLLALLAAGAAYGCDAIAVACDMPRLQAALLARLRPDGTHDAVAPRPGGIWQPLCAGYAPAPCLAAAQAVLARGRRSLFAVLEELGPRAHALPLDAVEEDSLIDWDTPEDVAQGGGRVTET